MKNLSLGLFWIALVSSAFAQTVSVKEGNIQFTDKAGTTTALTTTGNDSDPVLAPDRKWIVFVRKIEGRKIATGSDEMDPTELWQVRVDGKEPAMLLRAGDARGNDIRVVPAGEYKDCLLVQQHRYFIGGGAYDWYWLFRTDGKEIGPLGEDTSTFEATYGNE
jgi:WD40-like Beta Propeller Repeat